MAKITDWFRALFNLHDGTVDLDVCYGELAGEVFYKQLALQAGINLIANTISRGEFLTFEEGKEVRRDNYYKLNVEPNQNNSASKFWRDIVYKLIYEGECLVVQINEMFYVADEFEVVQFALKENIYKKIKIDDYELKETYSESKVLHFELSNTKIITLVDGICDSYAKLVKASSDNYKKNNARRGKLKVPTNYPQTEKAQSDLTSLLGVRFKKFFEAEGGAVLPLTNGLEYEELISNIGAKGGVDGREIRAFIDDIFDFVAISLSVPPKLLKGDVADTEKTVNDFLTFCVNPIGDVLVDEVNRKYYGKELFLKRTYTKLDTTRIKVVELKDIANALDVMLRSGANTINDNLRILGRETIDSEIGDLRWVTKNYTPITEMLKGGE